MDLHGLISGPAPRSTGSEGKVPALGPGGQAGAFGEVVASARPQRMAQDGAGDAGTGSADQPDPATGQLPAPMFVAADSPASLLPGVVLPALPTGEIAATAPDAALPGTLLPDAGSNFSPGASGTPVPDRDDAVELPEMRLPVEALTGAGMAAPPGAEPRPAGFAPPTPAAGGPAATPAAFPTRAIPGAIIAAPPGSQAAPASPLPPGQVSPGTDTDPASPLPRAAGGAVAPDPGALATRPASAGAADAAIPATPSTTAGMSIAAATDAPAAQPNQPGATSRRMTATPPAPAGEPARDPGPARPGILLPDPRPGPEPKPAADLTDPMRAGGRATRPAPAALPIWASAPPPGGPPAEPEPGPMPVLPALPPTASKGRGSVVRDAVTQALGDSGRVGAAASSAATTPPDAAPATAPAGLAGGADIARAVAPQIAAAIASGPGAALGSGRIELRLDPPELGLVKISLDITDHSLRATLAAERPATGELLRQHGEILLAQLQRAGFTGIDLQFTENHAGDRGGAHPGEPPRPAFAGDRDAPPDGANADRPAGRVARRATDGLDLRL